MKKILIPILFLLLAFPAMSQGWVYVNGTMTSEPDSADCDANFTFYDLENMAFQFLDLSMGNPQNWYWDFGDGGTSAEQNPVHNFNAEGWYTVTLTISDQPAGCYDSISSEIYVSDTIVEICQAFFEFYPDPAGSPDSYQFTDLSTGDIYLWDWDFGDGTFSQDQNPNHLFPGPGTYEVCLLVFGDNCSDNYCNTIVISDTGYQQIFGQVFSGNFPLQTGTVMLFALNSANATYTLRDSSPVDSNGIYYFSLVPEGNYIIQAVPDVSGGFMPTYYGDVAGWQQALPVSPVIPAGLFNISLIIAGPRVPGPGSVSGQINTGRSDPASIDLINMLLMDENGVMIGFSNVSEFGVFDFQSMDYGIYYLHAELSGVASDNMQFEITPERPHAEIFLSYSGNSVLGTGEDIAQLQPFSVYPNPFIDKVTISFPLPASGKIEIGIYSITGRQVFYSTETGKEGENTIIFSLEDLSAGIYSMRVISADRVISCLICSQK